MGTEKQGSNPSTDNFVLAESLFGAYWASVLLLILVSDFLLKEFFAPFFTLPFFAQIGLYSFILTIILFIDVKKKKGIWLFLLLLCGLLNGLLMLGLSWNHPLFFVSQLFTIVLAGLIFKTRGSYSLALISMIIYNGAGILAPPVKGLNGLLVLIINNLSFLATAFVAGRLTEYLEDLGWQLRLVEKDLREIKNLHEQIVSHIPSAIIAIIKEQDVLPVNRMAETFVGYSYSAHPEKWLLFINKLKEAPVNQFHAREFRWDHPERGVRVLHCRVVDFPFQDSELEGEIVVIDDVTEIQNLETIVRQQEKLAAVGKLAAGIAHEIRNPLASISGSVQLLSAQATNDEDQRLFRIVIKETDRLNLMITEFLDYAKPLPAPTETLNLGELMAEVMELVKYNQRLRQEIQQELHILAGIRIRGFKDKLKQALLNIVINAYQAMEKSAEPVLKVSLTLEEAQPVLRIKDKGGGMSEETKRRLFEPFYTTKSQGTGLGLAVTHKIFEAHGASILVESELGLGTEFVIKFNHSVTLS